MQRKIQKVKKPKKTQKIEILDFEIKFTSCKHKQIL